MSKVYLETNVTPRLKIYDSSNDAPSAFEKFFQIHVQVTGPNDIVILESGAVKENLFVKYAVPVLVLGSFALGAWQLIKRV